MIIPLRQLIDEEWYVVQVDGQGEIGMARGKVIKRAMRQGQHTKVRNFISPGGAPGGYFLVQLTDTLYIAARSSHQGSPHFMAQYQAPEPAHHEPAAASEPEAGDSKPKRGFKKPAPEPPPAPAKPAFAKFSGFKRRP